MHKRPQPVLSLLIKTQKNPKTEPTLRHASRLVHFHETVNIATRVFRAVADTQFNPWIYLVNILQYDSVRVVVLDNLREGMLTPDIYDPILNSLYRDVLAPYGVTALPCRVGDPDRKGKIEAGIGHAQKGCGSHAGQFRPNRIQQAAGLMPEGEEVVWPSW